jgi:hypothetical protein
MTLEVFHRPYQVVQPSRVVRQVIGWFGIEIHDVKYELCTSLVSRIQAFPQLLPDVLARRPGDIAPDRHGIISHGDRRRSQRALVDVVAIWSVWFEVPTGGVTAGYARRS